MKEVVRLAAQPLKVTAEGDVGGEFQRSMLRQYLGNASVSLVRVGVDSDADSVFVVKGGSALAHVFVGGMSELVRRRYLGGGATEGLREALEGLDTISDDAADMGYPVPQDSVVSEARRILGEMYSYRQLSFDAYAMSGGRVGIDVNGSVGRSMIVVCEPAGSALCVVTVGGVGRRSRYEDSGFLVDDFVKQGLRDMSYSGTGDVAL